MIGSGIRKHKTLVLLSVFGLVLGYYLVATLFQSTIPILIEPDSMGYMNPVRTFFEQGILVPTSARKLGYPLFLLVCEHVFGLGFRGIVGVQLALYAIVGILYFVTAVIVWRKSEQLKNKIDSRSFRILSYALCLSGLMFLGHRLLIGYAHAIMPEALVTFYTAVSAFLVVWAFFVERGRFGLILGAFASSLLAVSVKPHVFGVPVLIAVGIGLLVLQRFRAQASRRWAQLAIFLAIVFVYISFQTWEHSLQSKYDQYAAVFGPKVAFCFNSPSVIEYLKKTDYQVGSYSRTLMSEMAHKMEGFIQRGPAGGYFLLGFSGDHCLFDGEFEGLVRRLFNGQVNSQAEADFYLKMFKESVFQFPKKYLSRIVRQYYYVLSSPTRNALEDGSFDYQPTSAFKSFMAAFPGGDAQFLGTSYAGHFDSFFPPHSLMSMGVGLLNFILMSLIDKFLLFAGLPLSILVIARFLRSRRETFLTHQAFQVVLLFFFFVGTLFVPILVHTVDVWRYLFSSMPIAYLLFSFLTAFLYSVYGRIRFE